jgi:elongation factor Ts
MAEISATRVKELRDKTGAGMMDCKKALQENGGDVEAAVDWLRKKGLAAAAKKAGRVAADGLIGLAVDGSTGAVVEVNAETDFVARNEQFQGFVARLAELAIVGDGTVEGLLGMDYPGSGRSVGEEVVHMVATIGENIAVRRVARLHVSEGVIASYIHNAVAPGLGKIGVLTALQSAGDAEALAAFGKQLAMHIAAARPEAVTVDQVDRTALDRERAVLSEQARASDKPDNIIEKMVEGRLRKYYEEVVLLEQVWVIDGESRVKAMVEKAGKDAGAPVAVADFARFALGEGIEKEKDDFASEVAATLGS